MKVKGSTVVKTVLEFENDKGSVILTRVFKKQARSSMLGGFTFVGTKSYGVKYFSVGNRKSKSSLVSLVSYKSAISSFRKIVKRLTDKKNPVELLKVG